MMEQETRRANEEEVQHAPSILASSSRTIILRIKGAKLYVFLRHHRHKHFNDAFQEELATLYAASLRNLDTGCQ
jgi:hypothetical protein